MLQCSSCDKRFKYESERKRHEQSHSPQFECQECLKKFSFVSALRRHQKQHERTGAVQCNECGRNFRDDSLLLRHIKYAHKGTHICRKCNRKFNSDLALLSHMKTHISNTERKFKCNYNGCNKSFNFIHHLKHHKLTHTDTKLYHCDLCGKGFIQAHHLKSHLKSHDAENWVHCNILKCNKSFATEYALRRHLATHKNNADNGISSTFNTDVSHNELDEKSVCTSCGQLVSKCSYEKHKLQCIPNDYKNESMNLNNIVNTNIHFSIEFCKTNLNNDVPNNITNDNKIMSRNENNAFGTSLVPKSDTNPNSGVDTKDIRSNCEGCCCGNNNNNNHKYSTSTSKVAIDNNVPRIKYKSDGTIKIEETFDLEFVNMVQPKVTETIKNNNVISSVPFNSCKDVLGKCIVSGNGTISDECLCARMAFDEQEIIEQEIDEITPQPAIAFA